MPFENRRVDRLIQLNRDGCIHPGLNTDQRTPGLGAALIHPKFKRAIGQDKFHPAIGRRGFMPAKIGIIFAEQIDPGTFHIRTQTLDMNDGFALIDRNRN